MDMAVFTHGRRSVQVATPFGAEAVLFGQMSATEQLSAPFQLDLRLLSPRGDLSPDAILGKPLTVTLAVGDLLPKRHFNGLVTDFSQGGYTERLHEYHATVRPWLWFLTRTADCRVFQGKSVPDIFGEVCRQAGFSDFRLALTGTYDPLEYCVQYRETDFHFLSRLLELEGIFYFFEHSSDKHTLVLSDDAGQLATAPGYDSVPFYPPSETRVRRERDHLSAWQFQKSFHPGTFATREYDFKTPSPVLAGTSSIAREHEATRFEVFEYPALSPAQTSAAVERMAKVRVQEIQCAQMVARGSGDAAGLEVGKLFKLTRHPRADLNIQYLVSATSIHVSNDNFQTNGADEGDQQFSISLEAHDAREAYRPLRVTPKPLMQGTQTAVVVGPKGEEIHTDEYGRVKVQFHWDRYGKLDENSSCWVRVAQAWAGKNWGAVQIPRIGQEVVVTFLEGDPDRPLILGSVYNGSNKPPYSLPENKTQSGILSRSSPEGLPDHASSLRFEDKKGAEQVYLHAERNMDSVVEADETQQVGGNRAIKVKGAHHETVGEEIQIESSNGHVSIKAATSIQLTVGSSTLSMDKEGNISLNGKLISTDASDQQIIKGGKVFINP